MRLPIPPKYRIPLLIAAALLIITPPSLFYFFLTTSSGTGKNVFLFDFGRGQSLKRVATALEERKVIRSAGFFVLYARLHGDAGRLKAGYYQFSDALPPVEILRRMVAGEVFSIRFTVPEGYSIYQVAELLSGRRMFDKDSFLKECFNRHLIEELGIKGKSVEGYLYPSTYDFNPGISPADVIRLMVKQFEKVYQRDFSGRATECGLSRQEIIILASMIEKEAMTPRERPIISSVFRNRLLRGMPLQSDPTAVYGVRAFAGPVSRQDICRKSPYNTYLIGGLPPGPIGNPGSGAIEAAINPAKTNYLYFVAKKDGTHFFSRTLEEHNLAVRRFLKS